MVRLGTKAQKLNIGKKCCLSGKSWTKLDLRALTFVGTTYQTTNIGVVPQQRSINVYHLGPLTLGAASGLGQGSVFGRVGPRVHKFDHRLVQKQQETKRSREIDYGKTVQVQQSSDSQLTNRPVLGSLRLGAILGQPRENKTQRENHHDDKNNYDFMSCTRLMSPQVEFPRPNSVNVNALSTNFVRHILQLGVLDAALVSFPTTVWSFLPRYFG